MASLVRLALALAALAVAVMFFAARASEGMEAGGVGLVVTALIVVGGIATLRALRKPRAPKP